MTQAPTLPDVEKRKDEKLREGLLRPWSVILHNDDVNEMVHVVRSLMKSIPKLGARRATQIMFEAHNHGKAVVTTCPLELAELYRDRLQSCGLTATIEKA
jgi:ATP-dependent Clp protease adaptor protein ClpS